MRYYKQGVGRGSNKNFKKPYVLEVKVSCVHQPIKYVLIKWIHVHLIEILTFGFQQLDAVKRTCSVSAVSRNFNIGLRMQFPENYPCSEPPTFEFLESNLNYDIKRQLHKVIATTNISSTLIDGKYQMKKLSYCLMLSMHSCTFCSKDFEKFDNK